MLPTGGGPSRRRQLRPRGHPRLSLPTIWFALRCHGFPALGRSAGVGVGRVGVGVVGGWVSPTRLSPKLVLTRARTARTFAWHGSIHCTGDGDTAAVAHHVPSPSPICCQTDAPTLERLRRISSGSTCWITAPVPNGSSVVTCIAQTTQNARPWRNLLSPEKKTCPDLAAAIRHNEGGAGGGAGGGRSRPRVSTLFARDLACGAWRP